MLALVQTALEQGFIYGILAMGVVLSFRLLDFPDLTIDGSFTLGGAVTAILIVHSVHPVVAVFFACVVGGCAGLLTGVLHGQLKITKLLSGILVMTMLYSLNLRIMGRANISLLDRPTIFRWLERDDVISRWTAAVLLLVFVTLVFFLLKWFLSTEIGGAIRAVGDNESMAVSVALPTETLKLVGLAVSNALVALSGSLLCQQQAFADIGVGVGTLVTALASIIIGEVFVAPSSLGKLLLGCIFGAVTYFTIVNLALRLGIAPTDLKLATALLVILALATGMLPGKEMLLVVRRKY